MTNHPILIAVGVIALIVIYYLYLQPHVTAYVTKTTGPALEDRKGRGHF